MGSTAATSEQLDTRPLIGSFGVEITGIDVRTADRETLNEVAAALAHQWIFYDWIRTALIAVGFVASLLAMSRNADAYSEA